MIALTGVFALVTAACGGGEDTGGSNGDEGGLLGQIRDRGTIRIAVEGGFEPVSFLSPEGELIGLDPEIAALIADELGVELEIPTVDVTAMTTGNWGGRWDMAASIGITIERMEVIDYSIPYYQSLQTVAVPEDSEAQTLDDLEGATFCVGEGTVNQFWLEGTLNLAEESVLTAEPPAGAEVTTFGMETECGEAIRAGRDIDAWLATDPVIREGIAGGIPARVLDQDAIIYLAVAYAFDKNGPPYQDLLNEVNELITQWQDDGTLRELSEKWFEGIDYTTVPS